MELSKFLTNLQVNSSVPSSSARANGRASPRVPDSTVAVVTMRASRSIAVAACARAATVCFKIANSARPGDSVWQPRALAEAAQDHQPHRQGRAPDAAETLGRDAHRAARASQRQRPRIGPHAPVAADERVLVAVVGGAGAHQRRDQRALARVRATRQDDRPPAPGDDAGVHEEESLGVRGDVQRQLRLERLLDFGRDATAQAKALAAPTPPSARAPGGKRAVMRANVRASSAASSIATP